MDDEEIEDRYESYRFDVDGCGAGVEGEEVMIVRALDDEFDVAREIRAIEVATDRDAYDEDIV